MMDGFLVLIGFLILANVAPSMWAMYLVAKYGDKPKDADLAKGDER